MAPHPEIRIGITGHRNLVPTDELVTAIHLVLDEIISLSQQGKKRTDITLTAVSPLAEGTDRLVAREILLTPGGQLHALLPFPADEYAKDFADEKSHEEFFRLLRASSDTTIISRHDSRVDAYRAVGRMVLERCDVLIAIWDGAPARGKGGTAETVAYARSLKKPLYLINRDNPLHITRERIPNTGFLPLEAAESGLAVDLPYLDTLDDQQELYQALKESILTRGTDLSPDTVIVLVTRLKQVLEHFGPYYHEAGKRSESFQRRYRLTSKAVYVLAPLAVLIVAFQSIFHLSHWVVAGEFAAISIILAMTTLGNRQGWHMTWLENRLQAEWFRHGMFVAFLSGQTTPGIDRHWACRWVTNSEGVIKVRKAWAKLPHLGEPAEEGLSILKDFMERAWLEEQRLYHKDKSKAEIIKHKRIRSAGEIAFWGTFVAAALHMLPHSFYHFLHLDYNSSIRILTMLAIGLPTIGAAFTGLHAHFEYKKIAARSAMMAEHLHFLIQDLDKVASIQELNSLVQETEMLMLQENSDWYFTLGLHELEKG